MIFRLFKTAQWRRTEELTLGTIRKKFRKMKRLFDIAMQQSNALFLEEHDAIKTAKRIAQENEYTSPLPKLEYLAHTI